MGKTATNNLVTTQLTNPFPGLRPFSPDEAHLFFGREGQSEEILANLAKNRFTAVLGASGSGKSSLIYCGLLPVLYGGFLQNGRSIWRIAVSRPGSSPIANLATSLAKAYKQKENNEAIETESYINQAVLQRSPQGIANIINQYGLANNESILILIDQFEELFRYQYSGKDADAIDRVDHFVSLIVNAIAQSELPIYVVITMRSDFIGDCSPYQQFTKLINDSHYLIPRMTRDDFEKAITGPVAVGGGRISEQLVQLLLNEMGNNPDHLPILQHALMRTWDYWVNQGDTSQPMGIVEYDAIGRLERALSNHSNEAYDELTVDQKRACEVVFKSLTEKGADNRGIRRPTSVKELAAISESSIDDILRVVEVFRQKGRTFLTPSPKVDLTPNSVVDISHESLMRVWDKLKVWVEEESSSVKMYLRLSESADQYFEGKTTLWGPPDLQLAISWRDKQKPNLAWAERYHPAFEKTLVYLRTSEEEYIAEEENKIRLQKRAIQRSRIVAVILGTAGMISIALGIWALTERQAAIASSNKAIEQEQLAIERAKEAEDQRKIAKDNEKDALTQKELAEENRLAAEKQKALALWNLKEADTQRAIAQQKSIEAQEQEKKAVANALRAQEEQKKAEQASREAENRRMLSIAQSMAVKSQLMKADTLVKGLLAFQAYHFNSQFEGLPYNPDIFSAIYSGLRFFKGTEFNVLPNHSSMVRSIIASNEGMFSSGSDGKLVFYNQSTNSVESVAEDLNIVKKLVLHGDYIYGTSDREFFRYSLTNKTIEKRPLGNVEIKDLFADNSGRFLFVYNQSVALRNSFDDQNQTIYTSDTRINAAKMLPVASQLFLAMADGKIVVLKELFEGKPAPSVLTNIPGSNWGEIGLCIPRKLIVGGYGNNQGTIHIWNYETGQQLTILRGHNAKVTGIAFSADAKLMATASYDGTVRLWHMDDLNTLPVVFDDHNTWVTALRFSANGSNVISGDREGKVRFLPISVETMVDEYCQFLTRTFTTDEWNNYVGYDIPYKPNKCE
jgi:energy-coupling factor transporter ATP-binding protein EcfA2